MKKLFYLLLALPLVFAACEDPEEGVDQKKEYAPELTLTSEAEMNFEAAGGDGVITYTAKMVEVTRESLVSQPEVEATCEADWVTDLAVAENITFKVAANEAEARDTKIVVTYGDKSFEVAVKQAAKGEEPKPNTPVFEAVNAVVEYDWNTVMGEVEYKLENPIEGVEVKAKSNVMWISQLQAKDGKIIFALAENKGDAREGKITAEYGMLPAIEFTVKQGAYVAPAPVVTIIEENVNLAYDATEGSFTYTVENPVEGVVAEATTDAEWISNLTAADGTVSFTTSVNEGFVREATITVTYGEASDSIVVKQGAAGQNPDLDYYAYGIHTFEAKPRTADTWDIIMSELHPERGQMFTRITVKLSEDNTGLIPTGEYSTEDGSIIVNTSTNNSYSTWRYNSTATDINICELYVENDLEAHTSYIEGMFQVGNEVYGFVFEGAVSGFMYEELGEDGVTNWTSFSSRYAFDDCYIFTGNAEGFNLEFYIHEVGVTKNNHGTCPSAGTYPVLNWMYSTSENYCEGANGGSKVNGIYLKSEGQVVIEEVAEGYKVTFDVVDNNGTAWKGSYTGAL